MPGIVDPPLLDALATEVRVQRNRLKLTQAQLAERSRLGSIFINRVETRRSQPTVSSFVRIAQGLELDPEELLDLTLKRMKTRHPAG